MSHPKLAVDGIILYEKNGKKLVAIKRTNPPFKGEYALPGGFVEYGEKVEEALKREMREETGLNVDIIKLVGVYSDPERDPRGHVVSICYLAKGEGKLKADSDAESVFLFDIEEMPNLAFDHEKMIEDAREDIDGCINK
jgi:8-oxo-dGTP diphosphatase